MGPILLSSYHPVWCWQPPPLSPIKSSLQCGKLHSFPRAPSQPQGWSAGGQGGSGIIAVVVASCTCYNVRHCAISQCTTLGLIRSLPLGRWGCLGGVRWAQQGSEDANVGGERSSEGPGMNCLSVGKIQETTPETHIVMSVLDLKINLDKSLCIKTRT